MEECLSTSQLAIGLVSSDERLSQALLGTCRQRGWAFARARSVDESRAILRSTSWPVRVVDLARDSPLDHPLREAFQLLAADAELMVLTQAAAGLQVLRPATQALHYRRCDLTSHTDDVLSGLIPGAPDPTAPLIRGQSPAIEQVRAQIAAVAKFRDVSVLVLGETGTGKELVARAVHNLSTPAGAPFVAVNCAAIPATLFESELFGHEAGAFSGAKGTRAGLFESAADGTIFLDEVGELPAELQPKLLRALETREFRRVGGTRNLPLRARVVSATNQGLEGPGASTLRLDLHFRLAGFTIELPPLRRRMADVEGLARHFLAAFAERNNIFPTPLLTDDAVRSFASHTWPGNVRELRAAVEHAVIMAGGAHVDACHVHVALERGTVATTPATVPDVRPPATQPSASDSAGISGLRRIERDLIVAAYDEAGKNLTIAARVLGMPRTTLRDKLRRFGVL